MYTVVEFRDVVVRVVAKKHKGDGEIARQHMLGRTSRAKRNDNQSPLGYDIR